MYIVDQNRHSMLFKVTRLPGHTHSTRIAQGHPQTLALAPALALLNDLHDIVAAREKSLGEEANDDVLEARPSHSQRTSSSGGSADTHPIAFPRSCRQLGLTDPRTVATYRHVHWAFRWAFSWLSSRALVGLSVGLWSWVSGWLFGLGFSVGLAVVARGVWGVPPHLKALDSHAQDSDHP